MKCRYCGNDFEGEGVSIYTRGELIVTYCSANCMTKAFKKMTQLLRKLNKKELELLFDSNINSGKGKNK